MDIALGMEYLHHSMTPPIAHRDLRSPNVFLANFSADTQTVSAKVADFGMSRRVSTFIAGLGKTWQWLAPEVIDADSKRFDERADIYSYGIILWEILSREYPFGEFVEYYSKFIDENGEEVLVWQEQNVKQVLSFTHSSALLYNYHTLP